MAIQVWDGTKYVGAELGRFGPSGTLKEALVWDGAQYVKVWPTSPSYTWSDDFTSPTLHERWTNLGGTYTPPGLHAVAVSGPAVSASFQIDVTRQGVGQTAMYLADASMSTGVALTWGGDQNVNLMSLDQSFTLTAPAPEGSTVGVHRLEGRWHLVVDGEAVESAPDAIVVGIGIGMLQGSPTAPVTFIGYMEL